MFVKKFQAETFEKALQLVKSELGPNALILATDHKKGKWYQKPTIEVTAALERKKTEEKNKPAAEERFDEEQLKQIFPHRREKSVAVTPQKKAAVNRYLEISENSQDEAAPLAAEAKVVVEKHNPAKEIQPRAENAPVNRYENEFVGAGFTLDSAREFARTLLLDYPKRELENPQFLNKVKARIVSSRIDTLSPDIFTAKANWIAVGAPGSGKTSFLAKLALYLKKRHRFVELVSQDARKIVGRAELAAYAGLLQVPFHDSAKPVEGTGKIQLTDSPAFSWRQKQECEDLAKQCGTRHVVLVVDATQRLTEIKRTIDASRVLMPSAMALTRLDLVSDFGVLYEILRYAKMPLLASSVSRSFKIPVKFFEPLEFAFFVLSSASAGGNA